jgi:hypothetical protein
LNETKIGKSVLKHKKKSKTVEREVKLIISKWKKILRQQIREKQTKKKPPPAPKADTERDRIRAMFVKALD